MQTGIVARVLFNLFGSVLILAISAGSSEAQTPMPAHMQGQMQTPTQTQSPDAAVIRNFMFMPMAMTVKAGSTVTWKNLDGEPHTVVNDAGMFRSAALDQNDTYQFRFDKPGVYRIFCGIHPNMKQTITVQ